ncbi:MAG: ABC transporter permease [Candidatus Zixiibacteriota bacterium]
MLRNYVKVAWRSICRHKIYTFINITGLAIGMACCILIMLWVIDELSFDRFHEKADRIVRIYHDLSIGGSTRRGATISAPMGPAMVEELPEVSDAVRLSNASRVHCQYKDKEFFEENVFYADNSVFNVFGFPLIAGDPETALVSPHTIVITESLARKYFPGDAPLGKVIKFDGTADYTVTGVMADLPHNSSFRFDMLCSFETLYAEYFPDLEIWGSFGYYTYLLLGDNVTTALAEEKLAWFINEHMGPMLEKAGATVTLRLQKFVDIHLHSEFFGDIHQTGDINQVYLFSIIALFILLIACINFVNLATARSSLRAGEVGLRKTLGAARSRLVGQFLSESILYCVISTAVAVMLLELALPLFNGLTERHLSLSYIHSIWVLPFLAVMAILVGFAAGVYPAFFLSSFQPVKVLKGHLKAGASNYRLRGILVVSQFVISIALIIGTVTVYRQLDYIKHKNLGFDKEHVVVLNTSADEAQSSLQAFMGELRNLDGVVEVGASSDPLGRSFSMINMQPEGFGDQESQLVSLFDADDHFIPAVGIELTAGRNFSKDFPSDQNNSIIINEAAVKAFGWTEPIGKTISQASHTRDSVIRIYRTVIGVVKNFHQLSLREEITPVAIGNFNNVKRAVSVRLAPGNAEDIMNVIKDKWLEFYPQLPLDFYFLNDAFDSSYRAEEKFGKISLYFSLLAVFIGCLGLLGMASFTAEQRTKEIGIRKVLGASLPGIIGLMLKDFIILIVVANLIAWPIAWYGMHRWLQDFAYRISMDWTVFTLAAAMALLVAILTVSYQAVKAALANPVDALKHE